MDERSPRILKMGYELLKTIFLSLLLRAAHAKGHIPP